MNIWDILGSFPTDNEQESNIKDNFQLDYEAFKIENIDYGTFIQAYHNAISAICKEDVNEAKDWIEKAKLIYIGHPQQQLVEVQYFLLIEALDDALEVLNNHISENGNNYSGYAYRASVYFKKEYFLEACEDCKKQLEKDSDDYNTLRCFGESLFALQKYEEAFEVYQRLINYYIEDKIVFEKWDIINQTLKETYSKMFNHNQESEIAYKLATVYYYTNSKVAALELLEKLEQEHWLKHDDTLLGRVYLSLNKIEKAEIHLTKAFESAPEKAENLRWMGQLCRCKKRHKQAVEYYKQALALDPRNISYMLEIAELLNQMALYEEAIMYCNLSIKFSQTIKAYQIQGIALYHMENYKQSQVCFDKILEFYPQLIVCYVYKIKNYLASGEKILALKTCEEATYLKNESDELYCQMGIAYKENNKIGEAMNFFKKAVKFNENNAEAQFNIACLYCTNQYYKESLKHATKASELEKNNNLYRSLVAYNYNVLCEYEKAQEVYAQVISSDENEQYAYEGRGYAYSKLGKIELAIEDYKKSLQLNSECEAGYYSLGELYYRLSQYKNAIEYCTKGLALFPDTIKCLHWRGKAYFMLKEYKKASLDLEKVLILDPANSDVYYDLGNLYDALKDFNKAIGYYTKALAFNSLEKDILQKRGIAYHKVGKLKEADKDLTKVLYKDETDYFMQVRLGILKKDRGDKEYAKMCFKRAIKLNPEYADTYIYFGDLYKDFKKYEKGIGMWEHAISLGCEHKEEVYERMARTYQELGKIEDALTYCTKAIEVNPSNGQYYMFKGNLCRDLLQWEEAFSSYQTAKTLGERTIDCLLEEGHTHMRMGNHEMASKCYKAGLEEKEGGIALYYLGQLSLKQKKYGQAVVYFTKAIEDASIANPNYYIERGIAYKKQLKYVKAFKDFRCAVRMDKDNKKAVRQILPYFILLWTLLLTIVYWVLVQQG